MKRTVKIAGGMLAVPCAIWAAAALYFTVMGRDAQGDCACDCMPEQVALKDGENAYTFIKEFAARRHATTNLPALVSDYRLRKAYLNGTTNGLDAIAAARQFIDAESNTVATARHILASRGISVPFDEILEAGWPICTLNRITNIYKVKAICEAAYGDIAAGRRTLMELHRLGRFLATSDSLVFGMSMLIGVGMSYSALDAASAPLFSPDGDEAWRADLRAQYLALPDGDAARLKTSIKRALAGHWRRTAQVEPHIRRELVYRALSRIAGPERFLVFFPGYVGFAFQPNRMLDIHRAEAERCCRKIDEGRYDIEYARSFNFGRGMPKVTRHPLSRNWFGHEIMWVDGYGGSYVNLFRNRFFASANAVRLACRSHKARHGSYPETLDALVPEFLAEVPRDPFDGEPLRYDRKGGFLWTKGPERNFDGKLTFSRTDGSPVWTRASGRNVVLLDPKGM